MDAELQLHLELEANRLVRQGLTPEQARYHPYSNVITRCVGASEEVEPDTFAGEIRVGDVFLVASDGLTGLVDDRRLQQLLLSRASAGRVVDALIAEANYRGGLDNITAVVVQITAIDSPQSEETTDEHPAILSPTPD
jgi:protein phosphatase